MAVDDKILERIKKLLALSQSDNPNEAAVALNMAQKLMAERGVSETTLRLSDVNHRDVKSPFSVSKPKDYELVLACQVAKALGCEIIWVLGESWMRDAGLDCSGLFRLIGLKPKTEVASYALAVLLKKLQSGRSQHVQGLRLTKPWLQKKELVAAGDGYCKGWVVGVIKPLTHFAMGQEEQVLLEAYKNEKMNITGEADAQKRKGDLGSILKGREDGANEKLHRPMGTNALGQGLLA